MKNYICREDLADLTETAVLGGDLVLLPVPDLKLNPIEYAKLYGYTPEEIAAQPSNVRATYAYDQAIQTLEPLAIVNCFEETGIWYMIKDDELCGDLHRVFHLERLQGIKQLGFLQAPDMRDVVVHRPIAEHTRLLHSGDVMAIATLIGHNCGLTGSELNTLRAAAYTHDMGTPAGGDSVKMIDLVALDEDENYKRILGNFPERHALWAKYGIDEELLVATIFNQGLLGSILDIADKMAYTARDTWACRPYLEYGAVHLDRDGLVRLLHLIDQPAHCVGLWDTVKRVGDQVVFTDADALGAFLEIRTRMFRELYTHPHARFGEWMVSNVLAKVLYKRGVLTRDTLLVMRDYELEKIFDQEFPSRGRLKQCVVEDVSEAAASRVFETRDEAEVFRQELLRDGNPFVIIEDTRRAVKTGTHFLVQTKNGVFSFAEAYPERARRLEALANEARMVHVYYLTKESGIPAAKIAELLAECRD